MLFNPFRPNSIATSELFQGRVKELAIVENCLFQAKNGNPQHFLIEGERGLGKSSIFMRIAERALGITALSDGTKLKFIVINIELNASLSFVQILKLIAVDFKRAISEREKLKAKAIQVWEFLNKWEILGVKFQKDQESMAQPYEVLNDLVHQFAQCIKDASDEIDGIVILLDEADRPDAKASLGELVKLLTEKLTKKNCNQVLIGMTGQQGLVSKLKISHESAIRLFNILILKTLSDSENKRVICSGLEYANKKNVLQVEINQESLELISELSEGYPHFLQEFAFYAFDSNGDNVIEKEDVFRGAYSEKGALSQLGHKYFNEMYFDQIASSDYRRVLQGMSHYSDNWVERKDIKNKIEIKDTILNNALIALKNRNIIIANPNTQGEFRLPTKSFAAWIKAMHILEENTENQN